MYDYIFLSVGNDIIMADMIFVIYQDISAKKGENGIIQ